jgi:hypothetical protein
LLLLLLLLLSRLSDPGQQGGAGFADLIFGKVAPAGRSPQT